MKSIPDVPVENDSDTLPSGGGGGGSTGKVWTITGRLRVYETEIDGDEHDRPPIHLPELVARCGIGDRDRLRVELAIADRRVERRLPRREVFGHVLDRGDLPRERRRQRGEARGLDAIRREELQRHLCGPDVAARVAADGGLA